MLNAFCFEHTQYTQYICAICVREEMWCELLVNDEARLSSECVDNSFECMLDELCWLCFYTINRLSGVLQNQHTHTHKHIRPLSHNMYSPRRRHISRQKRTACVDMYWTNRVYMWMERDDSNLALSLSLYRSVLAALVCGLEKSTFVNRCAHVRTHTWAQTKHTWALSVWQQLVVNVYE